MNILHVEYTDIPKPGDRRGVEPRALLGDTAHITAPGRMVCGSLVDKACTRHSHSRHTKYCNICLKRHGRLLKYFNKPLESHFDKITQIS